MSRENIIKFIPLIVATLLVLSSFVPDFINFLAGRASHDFYSLSSHSIISIGIIWLTTLVRKNIWNFAFLIFVVASFFPIVQLGDFSMSLTIGSLEIDVISLGLLAGHVALNITELTSWHKAESTDEKAATVEYFEKEYKEKTTSELMKIAENDLVPEAKNALKKILDNREKRQ